MLMALMKLAATDKHGCGTFPSDRMAGSLAPRFSDVAVVVDADNWRDLFPVNTVFCDTVTFGTVSRGVPGGLIFQHRIVAGQSVL